MRTGRFLILLGILFGGTFLWAAGSSLLPSVSPQLPVKELSAKLGQIQENAKELPSLWDRLYRIVAFKSAVEAKLNRKTYVPLSDIPLTLQQAIIAVEDNRFYRHMGFDIEGIIRAALVNMQSGELVEGGSTITQQLIKNLFLTNDRTMGRKAEELLLSIIMEMRYTKEEIMEMYLNTIYFGSNAYGIGPATYVYFGKTPPKLTLAESTLLAGLPNAPSLYSPYEDLKAAKERQAVVLQTMVRHGFIGPNQALEAKSVPINLAR